MGLSRAPVIGRAVSGVLDRGAKANYDVRGVSALKNIGVDMGAAQKGGYREWEKGKIKEREEYAKTLEQTTGKFLGIRYGEGEKDKEIVMKSSIETAEKQAKEIAKQNKREIEEVQGRHKSELGQYSNNTATAKGKLAELEKQQSMGGTVSQGEIDGARDAIQKAQDAQAQKVSEQRKELDALEDTHEKRVEAQKEVVKKQQEEFVKIKNAGKEGYAEGLRWGPGKFFNRNVKAAEKIRAEYKKGKDEAALDSLKEAIKKASEEKKKEEKHESEEKH